MSSQYLITDIDTIKSIIGVEYLNYDFEEEVVFNDWKLDIFWIESLQRNVIALFKENELSFEYLFSMIRSSDIDEEIAVASLFIYYIDFDKKDENRERVLDYLTILDQKGEKSYTKIKIIVWETELNNAVNRRSIIGKSYLEIQNDAGYYRRLAEAARKLVR